MALVRFEGRAATNLLDDNDVAVLARYQAGLSTRTKVFSFAILELAEPVRQWFREHSVVAYRPPVDAHPLVDAVDNQLPHVLVRDHRYRYAVVLRHPWNEGARLP